MREIAIICAAGMLAGCVSQSSGTGAQAQFESFAVDAASAQLIADECRDYSMRSPIETLTRGYLAQMLAAGYSQAEIAAAISATTDDSIVQATLSRLSEAGVQAGNGETLCRFGAEQVAEGARIGSFLR